MGKDGRLNIMKDQKGVRRSKMDALINKKCKAWRSQQRNTTCLWMVRSRSRQHLPKALCAGRTHKRREGGT